jgi:tetratricopeptide (TPR) repeat protein
MLAFWNLVLWPIGLILAAIAFIGVRQYLTAGLFTSFAIYFAVTKTIPCILTRACPYLISRTKFVETEKVARFGLAWCKALKIESIGSLPRSLAWDTLLKSHLAQALLQQGRFDECAKVNQEILALLESEHDYVGAAKVSGKLAFCYTQQGKITQAASILERVVPVLEAAANNAESTNDKLAKAYRGRLCTALFEHATVLETKRDFARAEVLRRKAAVMSKEMEDDPDVIKSMAHTSMLGRLLIRLEKYEEAETLLDKVLEVRVKRLPPDSLLIASAKQGLGRLYCATDRLTEAESMLNAALACVEKVASGKHPDLPDYKGAMARLKLKQKKYDEAEKLLRFAIEQKEKQSGKDHPGVIDFLQDLAELKRSTGNIAQAEQAEERIEVILARMA